MKDRRQWGIRFIVDHPPVPEPRKRARVAWIGGRPQAVLYTPEAAKVNAFKQAVADAAVEAYSGAELEGDLGLEIDCILPRPKRLCWKKKPMLRIPCSTKPDFDNLAKGICDALNGIIWRDDAQVVDGRVRKWHAAGDENPHVEILVTEIQWQNASTPKSSTSA